MRAKPRCLQDEHHTLILRVKIDLVVLSFRSRCFLIELFVGSKQKPPGRPLPFPPGPTVFTKQSWVITFVSLRERETQRCVFTWVIYVSCEAVKVDQYVVTCVEWNLGSDSGLVFWKLHTVKNPNRTVDIQQVILQLQRETKKSRKLQRYILYIRGCVTVPPTYRYILCDVVQSQK